MSIVHTPLGNHTVAHVPESSFGIWFLGTATWTTHVLTRAMRDLVPLIPARRDSYPVVVDVGCGWGRSFKLLHDHFAPQQLIGIDVDPGMLDISARTVAAHGLQVDLRRADSARLPLEDASVDLLFCHQTFHHLVEQEAALAEFHRVLRPGGIMLFAESTRAYIHSWIIRLLFRHPMEVQRTAEEYLAMIRGAGFEIPQQAISYPYLWWSRADLGLAERLLRIRPRPKGQREETLINLVAIKA